MKNGKSMPVMLYIIEKLEVVRLELCLKAPILVRTSIKDHFERTFFAGNVAIKKLNVGNPGPALLKAFKNEVAVLKNTRHGNVLNFMGWIREPELAIVTQWCEGSSLYRHIHVMEPRVDFEIMTVLEIYKQISHGMSYLHSKNIIHRYDVHTIRGYHL